MVLRCLCWTRYELAKKRREEKDLTVPVMSDLPEMRKKWKDITEIPAAFPRTHAASCARNHKHGGYSRSARSGECCTAVMLSDRSSNRLVARAAPHLFSQHRLASNTRMQVNSALVFIVRFTVLALQVKISKDKTFARNCDQAMLQLCNSLDFASYGW